MKTDQWYSCTTVHCSREDAIKRIAALNKLMAGMLFYDAVEIILTAIEITASTHDDPDAAWDLILDMIAKKRRGFDTVGSA
jgi:hypothetical protein